jgi:hypothetical protein
VDQVLLRVRFVKNGGQLQSALIWGDENQIWRSIDPPDDQLQRTPSDYADAEKLGDELFRYAFTPEDEKRIYSPYLRKLSEFIQGQKGRGIGKLVVEIPSDLKTLHSLPRELLFDRSRYEWLHNLHISIARGINGDIDIAETLLHEQPQLVFLLRDHPGGLNAFLYPRLAIKPRQQHCETLSLPRAIPKSEPCF